MVDSMAYQPPAYLHSLKYGISPLKVLIYIYFQFFIPMAFCTLKKIVDLPYF